MQCVVKTVNRANHNQITGASKKSILATVNEKESRKIIIKTEKNIKAAVTGNYIQSAKGND